jgi:hypothetical protein
MKSLEGGVAGRNDERSSPHGFVLIHLAEEPNCECSGGAERLQLAQPARDRSPNPPAARRRCPGRASARDRRHVLLSSTARTRETESHVDCAGWSWILTVGRMRL